MVYENVIEGKYILLRSVVEEDAAFILRIRNDEKMNRFVNYVGNNMEKELQWIKEQRAREGDYFFSIIGKSKNEMLGNIAIYNIDTENKRAELGRWVSYAASMVNIEAVILSHDLAFDFAGVDCVYTNTLQENRKVVNFWKHFGGLGESDKEVGNRVFYYNQVSKEEYKKEIRKRFIILMEGKNDR